MPAAVAKLAAALTLGTTAVSALPSSHHAMASHGDLASRATTCNGHAELCNRQYSNVTYIGTHNSYAIGQGTSNLFANQAQSISAQLNDGVRMLQSQAHKSTNSSSSSGIGVNLCHSDCGLLNGGPIEDWLSSVKTWVDANPNDVVSLLIVNSDQVAPATYAQAFESTGLSSKMYSPSSPSSSGGVPKSQWPTLSDMINSGKTVVAYLDNSADVSTVPYLLPEFSSIWENPYDQTSVPFNCSIDRSGQGETTSQQMYLMNHFLDNDNGILGTSPDTGAIYTTNSEASVLQDGNNCASQHQNSYPTFILVDYYDRPQNDVFAAAASMNGVSFNNNTASSSSQSDSSSSNSGGSSGSAGQAQARSVSSCAVGVIAALTALAAATLA